MISDIPVGVPQSLAVDVLLSVLILAALRRIVVTPIKHIDVVLREIAEDSGIVGEINRSLFGQIDRCKTGNDWF